MTDASGTQRWPGLVAVFVVLMTATFVAYAPALQAGFVWEDADWITGNATVTAVDGLQRIWTQFRSNYQFYPLVLTSHWVEFRLWGPDAFGYHAGNIAMHALGALLLGLVLRKLSIRGALLAAFVFALHPVHVESVAWVTERKNVLSGLFYWLALLSYLHYSPTFSPSADVRARWRWYGSAVTCFVLALLSKTVVCSLPAVIMLLLWWRTGRVPGREIAALVPLFVLGLAFSVTTVIFERDLGAVGEVWSMGFFDRCLIAGRAICFYAGKLAWPAPLAFIYPRWEIGSQYWLELLFPVIVAVVMIGLWKLRARIGRGPITAVAIYCGTLVPALGFFDVYFFRFSYVADHFQYLASAALIALAGAGAARLSDRLHRTHGTFGTGALRFGGMALVALLAVLTWRQAHVYLDDETLWRDTLTKNPRAYLAHTNLGNVLMDRDEVQAATGHLAKAVEINPAFAHAHNNLGIALSRQGRAEEAMLHYLEAARLEPGYADPHNNIGIVFMDLGRIDDAVRHYRTAIRIDPEYDEAHSNLGEAMLSAGRLEEAGRSFDEALRLRPDDARVHNNLGVLADRRGDAEAALRHLQRALDLDPMLASAHNNLANVHAKAGRLREAVTRYDEALLLEPSYLRAWLNKGRALMQLGEREEALSAFERAVAIDPANTTARDLLRRLRGEESGE